MNTTAVVADTTNCCADAPASREASTHARFIFVKGYNWVEREAREGASNPALEQRAKEQAPPAAERLRNILGGVRAYRP
jgi:hypothetical protein